MSADSETDERPLVLVVTALPRDGELTARIFEAHGVDSIGCTSLAQVASRMNTAWCLVVTEEALACSGYDQLCRAIQSQPAWSDFPIILLTLSGSNSAIVRGALNDLGNVALLERPVATAALLSAVNAARRARAKQYQVRDSLDSISRAIEELERANRAKDELLALVSHELRTPLVSVVGTSDYLCRHMDQVDQAVITESIQDIRRNGLRLQRVIENMLVLASVDKPNASHYEPILLQKYIPEVLRRQGLVNDVVATLAEDLPPILANETYVELILTNLVSNAVKYGDERSGVALDARRRDEYVAVRVANDGIVVPVEVAEQVFEPFYRWEKSAAGRSGLGLGLSVCKRLVEVQGGTIRAESRDSGGLAVTFTLPVLAS